MPRAGGVYSLPGSYKATTGQPITVAQHNPVLEDIGTALTGSLPRDGSAAMQANMPMGAKRVTNMAAGTEPTDAVTRAQLVALLPPGIINDYAGPSAPAGWLLCYGQAVSRSTYSTLFAAIGTTYGSGDGSTTFNLPDHRGRVSAGKDDMGGTSANRLSSIGSTALGAVGGSQTHVLSIAEMPSHNHDGTTGNAGAHNHTVSDSTTADGTGFDFGSGYIQPAVVTRVTSDAPNHAHTIPSQGGGGAHNNVQPTIITNKIIWTGIFNG
ncbi:phage tail protein [Nitratireductor arenosus]|nr:tail fiber protein [Nitratireductor arenosus]